MISQAPVDQRIRSAPFAQANQQIAPAATLVRIPMTGTTWW